MVELLLGVELSLDGVELGVVLEVGGGLLLVELGVVVKVGLLLSSVELVLLGTSERLL